MTEPESAPATGRVAISLEVAGISLHFEGSRAFYEETLRDTLAPLAAGKWRTGPAPLSPGVAVAAAVAAGDALAAAAPVEEEEPEPAPAQEPVRRAAAPPPPPPPAAAPPRPAPVAAPRPVARAAAAAAATIDAKTLYGRLSKEEARRSERDAVLLALVSLAIAGKRDATPAEVVAHMKEHAFPTEGIKAKPVLAKLCHRKGMAAPGILPNTFRATPAGAAHIFRLSKG